MLLKDILELGTSGFDRESKVDIFDIENFEERLQNHHFDSIYVPQGDDDDMELYPYAFLIDDSNVIFMKGH